MPETPEDRLARAKQRSVLICTPVARHPTVEYTASFASTILFLHEQGIRVSFEFVIGSSVIHRARNELVARFLATDFTDLLFIDDDMQWSPNSVLRLLGSDKPVIGAAGRMRVQKPNSDPAVWCWRPIGGENGALITDEMGAVEVLGVGAAFLLINRGVFYKMAEAHPEWARVGAHDWPEIVNQNYFEFFAQERINGRDTSEDYVFCDRWRALGEQVWVDPTIRLGHIGSFNYSGSVSELLIEN